jgi:hypothetical protein
MVELPAPIPVARPASLPLAVTVATAGVADCQVAFVVTSHVVPLEDVADAEN